MKTIMIGPFYKSVCQKKLFFKKKGDLINVCMTKIKKEKWGRIHQAEPDGNYLEEESEIFGDDVKEIKMTKSSRNLGVNPTEVLKEIFDKSKGEMKGSIFGGFDTRRRSAKSQREVKSARLTRKRRKNVKSRGKEDVKGKSQFEKLTKKYGHLPIFGGMNKKSRVFKRNSSSKIDQGEIDKKFEKLKGSFKNIFSKEIDERMMKSPLKENLMKTYESPIFYISSQKQKNQLSRSRASIRSTNRLRNPPRPLINPKTERPKMSIEKKRENSRNFLTSREMRDTTIYEKVLQNSKIRKDSSRNSLHKRSNIASKASVYGDVEFRRRKARQQSLKYKKQKKRKFSKTQKNSKKNLIEKKTKKQGENNDLEEKLKKLNLKVEKMALRNKGFLQEYDWEREFELNAEKKSSSKKGQFEIKSAKKGKVDSILTLFSSHLTKSAKSKIGESAYTPAKKSQRDLNSSNRVKISSILTPKSESFQQKNFSSSKKKREIVFPLKNFNNFTPKKDDCVFTIPDTQTKIENYPEFKFLVKKISPLSQEKTGINESKSQNRMDQKLKNILPLYKRPENYGREEKVKFQNDVINDLKKVLAREQNLRLEKERQMLMMLVEDQKKIEFLENNLEEVFPKTARSHSRGRIRSSSAKQSILKKKKNHEEISLKVKKSSSKKKRKLKSNRKIRSGQKRRTKKLKEIQLKKEQEDISKTINFDEEIEVDKENLNRGDEQYRVMPIVANVKKEKKKEIEDFNFLYEDDFGEDCEQQDSSFEREVKLHMIKNKYKRMIEREKNQAEDV